MTNNSWVFEIYCQPIPSKLQANAAKQLKEIACTELNVNNIETYCSMTRLVLLANNLPEYFSQIISEIKGPKAGIANEILEKFLNKIATAHNLGIEKVKQNLVENEGYWYVKEFEIQINLSEKLQEIMHKILTEFTWIRTMKWLPNSNFRWIRPIKNLASMLNEKIIPFNFEIWNTNNLTFINDKKIEITAQNYKTTLLENNIYINYETRKQKILEALQHEQYEISEDLFEEIICSTENPHIVVCTDDETKDLMKNLPNLFIKTCVEEHQQAICLYDQNNNIDRFLLVAQKSPTERMQKDILNVIKYRLQDMLFMLEQDKTTDFAKWEQTLHDMPIYKGLGTVANKITRIYDLVQTHFPAKTTLLEAIKLYKLDLNSAIVNEFPTLHTQLIAELIKNEEVKRIILTYGNLKYSHPDGLLLGLLDKLDTLISFFTLPLKINSSQDPLGLKKLAFDIVEYGKKIPNLADLPDLMHILYKAQFNKEPEQDFLTRICEFIKERQEHEMNTSTTFNLNLEVQGEKILTDKQEINSFWRNWEKAAELEKFEELGYVQQIYKRLVNFVKNKEYKNFVKNEQDVASLEVQEFLVSKPADLASILALSKKLEAFFENNMVLDPAFAESRFGLLFACKKAFDIYACF